MQLMLSAKAGYLDTTEGESAVSAIQSVAVKHVK